MDPFSFECICCSFQNINNAYKERGRGRNGWKEQTHSSLLLKEGKRLTKWIKVLGCDLLLKKFKWSKLYFGGKGMLPSNGQSSGNICCVFR